MLIKCQHTLSDDKEAKLGPKLPAAFRVTDILVEMLTLSLKMTFTAFGK